ncbi:MAG: hypothetical protein GC165_10435 [Armatimonadetes bacterium]|nr:hypothetical protein [Armatimonadota bacterium]
MLTSALALQAILLTTQKKPIIVQGKDVALRLDFVNGEWLETFLAKDEKGKFREVLKSATSQGLPLEEGKTGVTALSSPSSSSLFASAPTFGFTDASVDNLQSTGTRRPVYLHVVRNGVHITKALSVPYTGHEIRVKLEVRFDEARPQIEYLFNSYAFAPDGKTIKQGGMPDSTFSPGLRKESDFVVGDHFFRSPAISAQKGSLAAVLIPDVESLKKDRVMPTVLDLDCRNGVVDAPLMSYGFCDYQLAGHVWYSHDRSMVRHVPQTLHLGMTVIVDAQTRPYSAHELAADYSWKVGHEYFDKILPQAMPFADYAKVCYPAVFDEHYGNQKNGWFDVTIDGKPCGGIMSGWGWQNGWVSWQDWFNNLRSAWGIRWWGQKLDKPDWVDKADKMLNLALAAPMNQGACPTTYMSKEKQWKGCLITPTKDCYYDLTNMAWKGLWLLKFLEFKDCPRRRDIDRACSEMAQCIMRYQNADGSFPTWLTKDLKVVPVLDHSAQTALPAWFLAEMAKLPNFRPNYRAAATKAADFLVKNVVDQQRYYDFETFFSCSPKVCMQTGATLDNPDMHDPHTLCPPQNTLSMQWTAEALRGVSELTGDKKYMPYALSALDMMCLYQNVWPISYRVTAYTYGGFGVQNSDGEYDDARQAQFGETLCDFGAQLGRQDYFERGVAATRATLTLINHPLHDEYGIYPNPNYPLGIEPENCGHGGDDTQAGRSGFDWGEGSGLTSMALLLNKYGETYKAKRWSVLVDGGSKGIDMLKKQKPLTDPHWDFSDWTMLGWHIVGDFAEVPTNSDRLDFNAGGKDFVGTCENGHGGFRDEYRGVIESPRFQVTKSTMELLVGGGSGKGVYVELIDVKTKEQLKVEHGNNSETMDERTWDISGYKGRTLQIRIVDNETGGWGHINVGNIRCQ